jgi:hypothetical protein
MRERKSKGKVMCRYRTWEAKVNKSQKEVERCIYVKERQKKII